MTQYAKYIDENTVRYPAATDFPGVVNWSAHDQALRAKGFVPLIDNPEERTGATPSPSKFALTTQTKTRIEPRPVVVKDYDPETGEEIGEHLDWQDTEITVDDSFITVADWEWTPIVEPEPEPLPTVFAKSEVLAALKAKGYYDAAFQLYQQSPELQLFWATYLEIDVEHAATLQVIEQLGLTQEIIDELRQWVVEAR